jgi:transposase-like protein
MAGKKVDLRNPIFHDEDAARAHLESVLWPQGPVCPRCGVMGDRITKLQGKSTRPGVYNCKDCRKPFSVTVGTVMERSHIPVSKWLLAGRLMAASKKSMSAHQLHRMMGITYQSAWFLFHRLREAAIDLLSFTKVRLHPNGHGEKSLRSLWDVAANGESCGARSVPVHRWWRGQHSACHA